MGIMKKKHDALYYKKLEQPLFLLVFIFKNVFKILMFCNTTYKYTKFQKRQLPHDYPWHFMTNLDIKLIVFQS